MEYTAATTWSFYCPVDLELIFEAQSNIDWLDVINSFLKKIESKVQVTVLNRVLQRSSNSCIRNGLQMKCKLTLLMHFSVCCRFSRNSKTNPR